jgi:hypothetical protein
VTSDLAGTRTVEYDYVITSATVDRFVYVSIACPSSHVHNKPVEDRTVGSSVIVNNEFASKNRTALIPVYVRL